MSLWFCKSCNAIGPFNHAVCPTCGARTQFADFHASTPSTSGVIAATPLRELSPTESTDVLTCAFRTAIGRKDAKE